MEELSYKVSLPGREELELKLELTPTGDIQSSQLIGIGGPKLLDLLVAWRPKITGRREALPVPEEAGLESMLLRELILRAKSEWDPSVQADPVCHCRGVKAKTIDQAIILGAHSVAQVRTATSASSACGTCAPTLHQMIDFRLSSTGASAPTEIEKKKAS